MLFGGPGHGVVWEMIVRVREERNMIMLDVYSKALRPALSIKLAAVATDNKRTTPTRAASYLKHTEVYQSRERGQNICL